MNMEEDMDEVIPVWSDYDGIYPRGVSMMRRGDIAVKKEYSKEYECYIKVDEEGKKWYCMEQLCTVTHKDGHVDITTITSESPYPLPIECLKNGRLKRVYDKYADPNLYIQFPIDSEEINNGERCKCVVQL